MVDIYETSYLYKYDQKSGINIITSTVFWILYTSLTIM